MSMSDLSTLRWERTVREDGSTHYELPPRPVNLTRLGAAVLTATVGLVLTLMGVAGVILSILWLVVGVSGLEFCWSAVFAGLLVLGVHRLRAGLTDMPQARLSIDIVGARLSATSRMGWMRRTRWYRLQRLRALQIEGAGLQRVVPYPQPVLTHRLLATGLDGPLPLADTYPLAWLEELANDLRGRLRIVDAETGAVRKLPDIPLEIRPDQAGAAPHLQPSVSQARLDWSDNRMSLTVPPLGIKRTPSAYGIICLILPIFGSIPTILLFNGRMPWPFTVVPLIVAGVGYFLLRTWLRTFNAVTTVTVDANGLHLHRRHFRDYDDRHWALNEIAGVAIGDSNLPTNKHSPPLPQVELRLADGHKVGLLAAYPREELQWVVHILQEAIERHPKPPEPTLDEILKKLPGGRLSARRIGNNVVASCPALGVPLKMVTYILLGVAILTGTGFGIAALVQGWLPEETHILLVVCYWFLASVGLFFGLGIPFEAFTDATRRRVFHIDPERLRIHEATIWGERERIWQRTELRYIDVGPLLSAGAELIPVTGLRLTLHSGKEIWLGQWHTVAELLWLARLLRRAFAVPMPPPT